jgi:hypothetical protein
MNSALAELPDTLAPSSHHLHSAPLQGVERQKFKQILQQPSDRAAGHQL